MTDIADSLDIRSTTDAALNEIDSITIVQKDGLFVTKNSIVMHILDQSSWARDLYYELSGFEQQQTLEEIGTFSLSIVANDLQIKAERGSNNHVKELEAPPVMPADLVKMRPALFISEVVDQYRAHLGKHWSTDMIDKAESEHRDLLLVYGRELNVKETIDNHSEKTFFNEAWDCLNERFLHLRQLCGGLATAFPNTTSVESDFSIIKWEKDDSRTRLTSISLVGIMHAKQFETLKTVVANRLEEKQ